jgi:hypothetical protein
MSKRVSIVNILVVLVFCSSKIVFGQYEDTARYKLILVDKKTEIIGYVADRLEDSITIATSYLGIIKVANKDIKKFIKKPLEVSLIKQYGYLEDYYLNQNAFNLKQDQITVSSTSIYFNRIAYGISESITLDVGTNFLSGSNNNINVGVYAGGKFSKSVSKKVRLAARVIAGLGQEKAILRPEFIFTYGTLYNNFSVNLFYNLQKNTQSTIFTTQEKNGFMYSFSGRQQIYKNHYFTFENIYFGSKASTLNIGIQHSKPKFSYHYGIIAYGNFANIDAIIFPLIGGKIII